MSKSKRFTWMDVILLLIAVAIIAVPAYLFYDHWKAQKREDLMWMARGQLELMKGDHSVEFLRLGDISYSDGTLHLLFHSALSNIDFNTDEDSLAQVSNLPCLALNHIFLLAYTRIYPESWDSVCKYLDEADVNLKINYQYLYKRIETEPITPEVLRDFLSEPYKTVGLDLYVKLKAQETLAYAKRHYKKDIAFSADSIKIEDKYVALHLSYDDKYSIEHFLDTTFINNHFTDDVGEMGSILDNMLEICVRTERGVAFVYTGNKRHKVNRLEWEFSRIGKYVDAKVKRGLRNDERKFNSVHTIVVKDN